MKTVYQHIKDYYESHQNELSIKHSGLRLERIIEELELMFFFGYKDIKDFLSSPYIPNYYYTLDNYLKHLEQGRPLQYYSKKIFFYNSYFTLNEDTLISRYETEILVHTAIEHINNLVKNSILQPDKTFKIVDIGTGPGNILLSILKEINHSNTMALGLDLSESAIEVAKKNYFRMEYQFPKSSQVFFKKNDRLNNIEDNFDLIVSNPPYIKRQKDIDKVHHQVKNYEPHLALFLDDKKYFEWFSTFFKQIIQKLLPNGLFLMEGHEDHLYELKKIFLQLAPPCKEISLLKDLNGNDRFLKVIK